MMSVFTASGWSYGTPLDFDLIRSMSEEPHLVRVFHLAHTHEWVAPMVDTDDDDDAHI
jgi:hypothetical protein